jgi:PAS domain S-box-containing protein
MESNMVGGLSKYQQYQQRLLFTAIKTTNIIFIIGIAVNSLWLPIVFLKALMQNMAALSIVLIGFFCSRLAHRGHLKIAVRTYLACAVTVISLITLNVGQNFILNVVLILTIFVLLSTFLEIPNLAHLWGCISAVLYAIALTARIYKFAGDLTLSPYDLVGFYAFPVLNFMAIALLGRGAAIRLSASLKESEDARDELERRVVERTADLEKANRELKGEISERIKAVEALEESEKRYRQVVDNANQGITVAQNGITKFVNPKMTEISGYSEEEYKSRPFEEFIHPDDREMIVERHRKRIADEDVEHVYPVRIFDKEGKMKWVEIRATLFSWEKEPATLNFITDITDDIQAEEEKKKLEAQLQQAQKMEAIGTLAGGIAHDFNNLLMAIQGRTSLMMLDTHPSHPHFEHLKGVETSVKSGAELTAQLLGFARGGKYEVKPTNLNPVIEKQNVMFGRTRKEITIHGKYERNLWIVEVDRGQMEQVLLNLYVNAWQAMPGGGNLYVQTENVTVEGSQSEPFKIETGKYVKISVTDTGEGMDQTTLQRIFEPFFTTKEMKESAGLGLASVYGIIKNHDGLINAYSEKGEGTTFNIYLPASEKEVEEEKLLSEEILKGTGTILLVDDEEEVIEVGKKVIESLGYQVLIAESGEEAIEIYQENKEIIQIVILDLVMPGMGGGETYDRLKKMNPEVRVLLSSGYSINGQAREIINRGCDGFLQKPFNLIQLSQKIREILDKK